MDCIFEIVYGDCGKTINYEVIRKKILMKDEFVRNYSIPVKVILVSFVAEILQSNLIEILLI